jgi:hypothetical protein
MSANGKLNNRQIALKGMVTKKKRNYRRKVWIAIIAHNMQFLEFNPMRLKCLPTTPFNQGRNLKLPEYYALPHKPPPPNYDLELQPRIGGGQMG